MAGKGIITTARGESLNLDDLIAKSKRPIGVQEQNSTIKKKPDPTKRKPLNVRGFVPAQGEAKTPKVAEEGLRLDPPAKAPVSAFKKGEEAKSVADMTGIRVEKKATTKKPDVPAAEAASEALGDILGSLEESVPNAVNAADEAEEEEKKPAARRRTRR